MTSSQNSNKEIWFDMTIMFFNKSSQSPVDQYTIGSFNILDSKLNGVITPNSICKYVYENLNEFVDISKVSTYIEGDLTTEFHESFGSLIKIPTITFKIKPYQYSISEESVQLIINNIHRI